MTNAVIAWKSQLTFISLWDFPIAVNHAHQRRVALKYVINEWNRNHDAGRGSGERQAREALDKRGEKRRRQVPRK
jgi:hypothetical protein